MTRRAKSLALALSVGLLGAALSRTPAVVGLEEQFGLAWLFRMRGPVEPPANVVIAALDKRSSDHLGLPLQPSEWPRSLHARLIDRLTQQGAAVIAFDLIFERPRDPHEDRALADAIARSGRVLLFKSVQRWRPDGASLPATTRSGELWVETVRPPLPLFADAADGVGPFVLPTVPTEVRRFWTYLHQWPTLPMLALQAQSRSAGLDWPGLLSRAGVPAASGDAGDGPRGRTSGALALRLRAAVSGDPGVIGRLRRAAAPIDESADPARPPPSDRADRLLAALLRAYAGADSSYLNFYGPPGTIRTVSYHQLLDADPEREASQRSALQGAVVFVGFSERDLMNKEDGFDTVFTRTDGVRLSGVEIAATAFANLATGRTVRPAGPALAMALLLVVPAVAGLLVHRAPARWVLVGCATLAGAYLLAAHYVFARDALWLPLVLPLLIQLPLILVLGLGLDAVYSRRERREIAAAVEVFVPERVVREVASNRGEPINRGKNRYGVCLYMDAENFVGTVENMAPSAAAEMLNAYFGALATPLERSGVSFKEFTADSVLFAWIADRPSRALRRRACRAALAILAANEEFNSRAAGPRLAARMALHAGPVYIGTVGGGGRLAYRMVGDTVNTASRIEGVNKLLGTRLLASDAAVEGVPGLVLRPLGRFQLRGRTQDTRIVEIIAGAAQTGSQQADLLADFSQALQAFEDGRGSEAAALFECLRKAHPGDGPSRFFHEYCRSLPAAPGDDAALIRMRHK